MCYNRKKNKVIKKIINKNKKKKKKKLQYLRGLIIGFSKTFKNHSLMHKVNKYKKKKNTVQKNIRI